MRPLAVWLLLAGCARAGPENRIIGGLDDAALSDAAPRTVTLSQTTSDEVIARNSIGCSTASGATHQISYYRVFALADHGIASALHVASVTFGIDTAIAGGGAGVQPAAARIGRYRAAPGQTGLDLTQVEAIRSVEVQIQDASATTMTVAIAGEVAPGASLVAELAIPDGAAQGHRFVAGSNARGERSPGYLLAPSCGYSAPTSLQSVADAQHAGAVDLVMTVSGFTDAAAP